MRNISWGVVIKGEMPQKGEHNGISDTFSIKRYNPLPRMKIMANLPTLTKKLKKYLESLDYFSNFADIYNKRQKVYKK